MYLEKNWWSDLWKPEECPLAKVRGCILQPARSWGCSFPIRDQHAGKPTPKAKAGLLPSLDASVECRTARGLVFSHVPPLPWLRCLTSLWRLQHLSEQKKARKNPKMSEKALW